MSFIVNIVNTALLHVPVTWRTVTWLSRPASRLGFIITMAQDGDTKLNKEIITRFIAPSFPKNCCTAISQAFLTQNKHVCLTRGLTLNRSGIDRAFYPAAALSKSKSYIECQSMTSLRVSHLNLFGANFAAVNIQLNIPPMSVKLGLGIICYFWQVF